MSKSRKDYSEELEKQYRRMERLHNEIVQNFETTTKSKSSEELLDPVGFVE